MTGSCADCGCKLSRYREPGETRCAPCAAGHAERAADPATPSRHGYCKRGHDLELHGVVQRAEGNRFSRRCGTCQRMRAVEYQRRRRALRRAIRNGEAPSLQPSAGDLARARYAAETADMLALREAGVPITEIARRVGANPGTISARLMRARKRRVAA